MNEHSTSSANGGFRVGALTPEEAERFAALFVPVWELPADVPTDGPDPGFKVSGNGVAAAQVDAMLAASSAPAARTTEGDWPSEASLSVAAEQQRSMKSTMVSIAEPAPPVAPTPPVADAPIKAKQTMMGIAAPLPQNADAFAPTAVGPLFEPVQAKPAARPQPMSAPLSVDSTDSYAALSKKRSPLPFVIGGAVLLGALGVFLATRGGDEKSSSKPDDDKATVSEPKKLDLPDPNAVAPPPTLAKTATTAAGTNATATATATATTTAAATTAAPPAKTEEPPPPVKTAPVKTVEPKVTAKPPTPPPPPKVTAKPPPPPPVKTAAPKLPGKKPPPKIKDEF